MAQDIKLMGATYSAVPAVDLPKAAGGTARFVDEEGLLYAASPETAGNAVKSNGILYGAVDSASTATVFTATIDGLTELYDGVTIMLHNGVVTSASGFTVNINGLGAKKCYSNMTNATQDTTIFNVAYTMLFVYSEALDDGNGGWWIYRGYDANTNTIGYQLRTNSANMLAVQTGYRYRLWFTDADGQGWVPANTSSATDATKARALNTRPIDPFGAIVYCSHNATKSSGAGLGTGYQWAQYTLTIGYSYVKNLVSGAPVYLKCTPQANGSAVMKDIATALPTTKDGSIYIFLGVAYSTTAMELESYHPVYWHDGTGIRLWTGAEPSAELPTVTASDNGKILQVSNGAWAVGDAPSGGGSSGLLVTITGSNSAGYQMDKTARQIRDALLNGISPIFAYDDGVSIKYWCYRASEYSPTGPGTVEVVGFSVFNFSSLDSYPSKAGSGGGDN